MNNLIKYAQIVVIVLKHGVGFLGVYDNEASVDRRYVVLRPLTKDSISEEDINEIESSTGANLITPVKHRTHFNVLDVEYLLFEIENFSGVNCIKETKDKDKDK
jgi:hypothetical protein